MGQSVLTQSHHQVFANDNSNADSCTALSTENARYEATPGTTYIVRLNVLVTEKAYGDITPVLWHRKNTGSWVAVDVGRLSPNEAVYVDTVNGSPTDGASLSQQLSGVGSAYGGGWYEDSSNTMPTRTLGYTSPMGTDYEFAFAVVVRGAHVAASDTLDFVITDSGTLVDILTQVDVFSISSTHEPYDYVFQCGWAWYDDDSANVDTCTAREATPENTSTEILTSELDTPVHLRFHIHCPDTPAINREAQLQFSVDGGTWTDVTSSSSYVRVASGLPTDDVTVSAERLTNQGDTFSSTLWGYDESSGVARVISQDSFEAECQYCIQFRSADFSGGETVQFRLEGTTITTSVVPLGTSATLAQATIEGGGGQDFLPYFGKRNNVLLRM